jgi:hypothetical protein
MNFIKAGDFRALFLGKGRIAGLQNLQDLHNLFAFRRTGFAFRGFGFYGYEGKTYLCPVIDNNM